MIIRHALMIALLMATAPLHAATPLKILFFGDNGHHRPAARFADLAPVLRDRGIALTYTDKTTDLNAANLAGYDGLLIYANTKDISPEQEAALLDYVRNGKGLIPLHCASYCFLNSPKYIDLVGAQFRRHGTGTFRTQIAEPQHPIMQDFGGFESWDETYAHHKHNERNRTVLEYRIEGTEKEPWTWVRTEGKGRVFYTAWGHDQRTWTHPGFQNLVERGIRWATGGDPALAGPLEDPNAFPVPKIVNVGKLTKAFEYAPANVAFYPPGAGRKGDGAWNKMQLPLEPAESRKHLLVPEGFTAELFAAEPQIGKPITMAWDERGRLWLAETVDYPNELQPEGEGRDRIRICEDTDGDGRADKFTVFAEKLSIPTSLAFSRGGVIVHQAPDTLFLKDTNGDDVCDERSVLFTGWSTGDTHAGPSNLQYGLDNTFWGTQGYAGFDGTVGGEQHTFKQGFHRFKPDGSKLEFLRSTNNNTWGLGFSEEGLVFASTANHNPSVYLPIPNRYYEAVRGWSATTLGTIADSYLFQAPTDKIRQVDHHGGYTAAAGHALYTARAYPKEYWNRVAFVTEPTGHLVGSFVLRRDGADFNSSNPFNLLASDDEWTAPIMAEVGPDGQVWVIDWYNYIVQHNPTPIGFKTGKGNAYETDLRDKKHGRIYRVVYKGPVSKPFSLHNATPEQLVATLTNKNMLWRKHAQRLLVERGKADVVPALVKLVQDERVDELGLNVGAIHALWTLHGLKQFDGDLSEEMAATVIAGLEHPSAGVRRNAFQVLPPTSDALAGTRLLGLLNDADPHVRLATLLAVAEMPPSPTGGEYVANIVTNAGNQRDRWLMDAATCAAARHDAHFLRALAAEDSVLSTQYPVLEVATIVAEHHARSGDASTIGNLLISLPKMPGPLAGAIVAGLARGWPAKKPAQLDDLAETALVELLNTLPSVQRGTLATVARRLGSKTLEEHAAQIAASFLTQASNEKGKEEDRIAAAAQLMEFRRLDPTAATDLLELVSPRSTPELTRGLLEALGRSEAPETGTALLAHLGSLTPSSRPTALRVLLSRADWTRALLDAAEQGQVQMSELSLDQKQALASHPDKPLANRAKKLLAKGGGLPNADRQKVLDELMPLTKQVGDAAAGKLVFTKQCAKCHTHSGEGNKVGPDLTGMAVHPKAELLTHLIDPSRSVEGNYRAYMVATADGRIFAGLLASESKTAIELFDSDGKRHSLLREDIEQLVASPKSLMPEGFEKQVTQADLSNLLQFLTTRGKYMPLPLEKVASVVTTRPMFHDGENGPDRLVFEDWGTKTVEGVPFTLIDPRDKRIPNAVLFYGPSGTLPPSMPKSVRVPCHAKCRAIHLLSGVSGWGYPIGKKGSTSLIVRLHYAGGATEDIPLLNGEHFADYIRRVDVPQSKLAFMLGNQQLRYLAVQPKRQDAIEEIEFVKGDDGTAPILMAVTAEGL